MNLQDGMWAVLFTDVVGSTEKRARLGDGAADELRREHDAIVARALANNRGELVEGTGDGAMCVFSSASDAIACGIAIQQAIERRNDGAEERVELRVGMSAGELVLEGSGLMGMAAHEAARICSLCQGGEVLMSDLVRLMAGTRTSARLVDRGPFELKGLPAAVQVWEATWEPAAAPELPVPARFFVPGAWSFSGRSAELEGVLGLWTSVAAGAAPRS